MEKLLVETENLCQEGQNGDQIMKSVEIFSGLLLKAAAAMEKELLM
jgi:hypothetical protein